MMLQAGSAYSANARYKYLTPGFLFVVGAVFLSFGLFSPGRASTFAMTLGVTVLVCALVYVTVIRKAFGEQEPRA